MSTRAAIIIKDTKNKNHLYRHCDGYPEGLGAELKDFTLSRSVGKLENSMNVENEIL